MFHDVRVDFDCLVALTCALSIFMSSARMPRSGGPTCKVWLVSWLVETHGVPISLCYNPHGRGGSSGSRGKGTGDRSSGGRGNFSNSSNFSNSNFKPGGQSSRPRCQLYGGTNHTALECWHRFEEDYQPSSNNKSSSAAYGVDTSWYMDSGATNCITIELDNMTVRDKYGGHDQVHTANGSGSGNEENSSSRQV
nr:uncharacterized protein LOC117858937 [Setaria viridis]